MASLPYPRSLLTAIFSHRFHRSAQNLLVEKGLPQIAHGVVIIIKLTKLLLVSLCRLKYNVYICNR